MSTEEIVAEISNLIAKLDVRETSESLQVQAVLLTLRGSLKDGSVESLSALSVLFGQEQIRKRQYSRWMENG